MSASERIEGRVDKVTEISARQSKPRKRRTKTSAAAATPAIQRGGAAKSVAALVPKVGGVAFRKFGFIQTALVSRWCDIVGERIADITQPAMIRFPPKRKVEGTLYITLASAHAPLIQHLAPDIIAAVNRFFGYAAVAVIRLNHAAGVPPSLAPLVHGYPLPASSAPVSEVRDSASPTIMSQNISGQDTAPLPKEIGDSLRTIADEELRTILERMATRLADPTNGLASNPQALQGAVPRIPRIS